MDNLANEEVSESLLKYEVMEYMKPDLRKETVLRLPITLPG